MKSAPVLLSYLLLLSLQQAVGANYNEALGHCRALKKGMHV